MAFTINLTDDFTVIFREAYEDANESAIFFDEQNEYACVFCENVLMSMDEIYQNHQAAIGGEITLVVPSILIDINNRFPSIKKGFDNLCTKLSVKGVIYA